MTRLATSIYFTVAIFLGFCAMYGLLTFVKLIGDLLLGGV